MVNREASPGPPPDAGVAEPVLILTPTGRDAALAAACLLRRGHTDARLPRRWRSCARAGRAAAGPHRRSVAPQALDRLIPALAATGLVRCALMLLTTSATTTEALWQRLQGRVAVGQVTLLERPLHPGTLLSTVQVALRSRRRQHDIRQLHEELRRRLAEQTAIGPAARERTGLRHLNETLEQRVTDRTAALEQQTQRLHADRRAATHARGAGAAGEARRLRDAAGQRGP